MRMLGTAKETADFPLVAQMRTKTSLAVSVQSRQGRTEALRPKRVRYLCHTTKPPSSLWGSEPRMGIIMNILHPTAHLACRLLKTHSPEAARCLLSP